MQRLGLSLLVASILLISHSDDLSSRTWYITADGTGDAPTIQAGIDSAAVGDVVLVAAGTYTWSNQGTGDDYGMIRFWRGVSGFDVRSESGPDVTFLDAEWQGRVMYIQAENDITIEGFTFTRGRAPTSYDSGGGLIGHLSFPVIRNCVFTGNTAQYGGGFWFGGVSDLTVEDCEFYGNTAEYGAGIFLINSSGESVIRDCSVHNNIADRRGGGVFVYRYKVEFDECVVYGNSADQAGGGFAWEEYEPSEITHCTIARNTAPEGGGIYLFLGSALTVRYSIIAWSREGGALYRGSDCALEIGCSAIYGNVGGDELPPGTVDTGGNFFLDPQFCGIRGSENYYLQSDSPCMSFNHPYGAFCPLIGAFPSGCGSVSVEEKSWGCIKKIYNN